MKGTLAGRNAVLEALKFGTKVRALYIDSGAKGPKIEEIECLAKKRRVAINRVRRQKLYKICEDQHHQGVVASIEREEVGLRDVLGLVRKGDSGIIVVLRELLYEQNFGAILRTCEAAGVKAVVYSKRQRFGVNSVVSRVSMGAGERLLVIPANLYDAMKQLHEEGAKVIGVEVGGKLPYYEAPVNGWRVFVIGGEDKGLSKQILERCDLTVHVPMPGKVTSLNVSATTAIILFDQLRRTNKSRRLNR